MGYSRGFRSFAAVKRTSSRRDCDTMPAPSGVTGSWTSCAASPRRGSARAEAASADLPGTVLPRRHDGRLARMDLRLLHAIRLGTDPRAQGDPPDDQLPADGLVRLGHLGRGTALVRALPRHARDPGDERGDPRGAGLDVVGA